MLLTYIHGSSPDLWELGDEKCSHVLRQMAEITVELASHRFDRIGCLVIDEHEQFQIGKDLETGMGPYTTTTEYYKTLTTHRFRLYANSISNNLDADCDNGLELPLIFNSMMPMLTDCASDSGPFSLTNTDFGLHNVLVDEDLNIVGVIDCDGIKTAPIHVVAQYPESSGLGFPIPGLLTYSAFINECHARAVAKSERYTAVVANAEMRAGPKTPLADAMNSDGARLFDGLQGYMMHSSSYNMLWIKAYWYLYYRFSKGRTRYCTYSYRDKY